MKTILLFCLPFLISCSTRETSTLTENTVQRTKAIHKDLRITGRVTATQDSVEIYWSGTSIAFEFSGDEVKAELKDEHGANYFNLVIDGDSVRFFKLDAAKKWYTLAKGLAPGKHKIELIKRNEWDKGKTWFYGLELHNATLETQKPASGRVIEFFGNSITAGYAIDDNTGGDSPDSTFTNNYYTYAAMTARHFNADYYCTVKSGIGIMISWFDLVMPQLYNRLDPSDSSSRWDFTKVQPQVVVINLFQNDSWLVNNPDHASFKQKFGKKAPDAKFIIKSYRDFVKSVRAVYPNAHIICALGSMDATKSGSPWPGYVTSAVQELHDEKIKTLFFPFTNKAGHPRRDDNEKMAKILIEHIEKNISW